MRRATITLLVLFCSAAHAQDGHIHKPIWKKKASIASRTASHWTQPRVGFKHDFRRDSEARRGQIDTGPFMAGSITYKPSVFGKENMVFKGIAIRIGDNQQAAVCFDTELMQVRMGWSGKQAKGSTSGFLKYGPAYMGLIEPPRVASKIDFLVPKIGWAKDSNFEDPRKPQRDNLVLGNLPRTWAHYKGMYQHGNRVVLEYTVGETLVRETPWIEQVVDAFAYTRTFQVAPHINDMQLQLGSGAHVKLAGDGAELFFDGDDVFVNVPASDRTRTFKVLLAGKKQLSSDEFRAVSASPSTPEDIEAFCKPGPSIWNDEIRTKGVLGKADGPFALDTITLPYDNPYNSLMFIGSHGFLSNGDVVLSTVYGDIWIASGVDDDLEEITWKRFATGLYQPLGMQIIDDVIYVACRDQICILRDRDGNGELDRIENFNNDGLVTWNPHEFVTNLERDSAGNFYVIKSDTGGITDHDGCVLRISPDGSDLSVVASGFRNSNGLTVAPDDTIFVSPQEGDWTPGSGIYIAKEGKFHGHIGAHHEDEQPMSYEYPMCWIPRFADNSSGSHVVVTSDQWGPMKGQLLHLSAGQCRMLMALQERTDELEQGGTVPFDLEFDSSVMRARFSPHDGQLYVSGMRSWVSRAAKDGCFHRVRYTGKPTHFPKQVRTFKNGLEITFYDALDKASIESVGAYKVKRWNYKWTNEYGSLHYRVDDPDEVGEDEVNVLSATLLDDKTVFLEIEDMIPVNQLTIDFRIRAADNQPIRKSIYYTVHRVPDRKMDATRLQLANDQDGLRKDDPSLAAGLKFRFKRREAVEARAGRLAALHVPNGEAPTPLFGPGPFNLKAHGYLNAEWSGPHRFKVEGNGSTNLEINGEEVGPNEEVELNAGLNEISLTYQSPAVGDSKVRLLWSSESFVEEPIPPTALFHKHDDAELKNAAQRRLGLDLYARHQCNRCHANQVAVEGNRFRAPTIAGDQIKPSWLAAWILNPHRLDPNSEMPQLLRPDNLVDQQKVRDLVAYLSADYTEQDEPILNDDVIELGEAIYEQLGCIACHRLTAPSAEDEYGRISLHHIAAKFRVNDLRAFLSNPHKHHPTNKMPNFRLSEDETNQLASFLVNETKDATLPVVEKGNSSRGKQLYTELRCNQCHDEDLPAPPLKSKSTFSDGCLSKKVEDAPNFHFTPSERLALESLLTRIDLPGVGGVRVSEDADQLIAELRCNACHARDGKQALLPMISAEEGRGLVPEFIPSLTWVGEKLQPEWMADFISGRKSESPRPWLKARMPSFPAYAHPLSHALVHQHAIDASVESYPHTEAKMVSAGAKIVSEQGLNCVQCHAKDVRPQENQDNIAPAIQFGQTRHRIREGYYHRFVMDPTRFEPRVKMPKLSLNGKTTNLKDVLDGDAKQQFEAVWQYILSQE